MFDYSYHVWADGGCLQNGTQEAHGYASYLLASRTGKRQVVRLTDLPNVSTKQRVCDPAEYVALISALVNLRGRIERAG